jgi:hypothetical protein
VDCDFFYEKTNYVNARNYVTRLYQNLLGRQPDENGLNGYANALANGQETAAGAVLELMESKEYAGKGYSSSEYVTRLYGALLGRKPGESETAGWVAMLENGVSEKYVFAQIVGSAEFSNVCQSYGLTKGTVTLTENRDKNYNATSYVMRCYQKILGRKADTSGLNTWTGKLLSGCSGAEIVKDLVESEEFKNKKYTDSQFVDIMYQAMLGRNADTEGKKTWMSVLNAGVSYRYVINGFAGSPEFNNLCTSYGIVSGNVAYTEARDENIQITEFVSRNYSKALGRTADTDGLNNWCRVLINRTESPQQVAWGFVFSEESNKKGRSNADFVEMLYGLCLGRNSDAAGKANWVAALDSGASRESVFWGFANSPEFANIISSYGL